MKMSGGEYRKFAEKAAPRSNMKRDLFRAFLSGGTICTVGQSLINLYNYVGFSGDDASALCSITLIFIGALLTGLGVYDDIAAFAGAGTLVPITGFANSVAAAAIEFKSEGFITGTGTKMFVIAGPVIVYGISASIVYGLILLLL
ncbi:MAG: stage V sporulation protein AC [Eubacteriales bacterium]|nr:stage V sporulation protein AC [Eubacteriales bacterium]